jgi:hypothetical protein
MATIPTVSSSPFTAETEDSPLGDGVFAQNVEVELDGVVYDTGQLADCQVDGDDTPGAILLGCLQRNIQNAFSCWEFVHLSQPWPRVPERPIKILHYAVLVPRAYWVVKSYRYPHLAKREVQPDPP